MTKYCRNCGGPCDDSFKYCPSCGAPLEEPKCPSCGAVVTENARFCSNCGACVEIEQKSAYVVAEAIEEAPSEIISPASPARPVVKKKLGKEQRKSLLKLIKDATFLALSVILFALSFADIVTVDADKYIGLEIDAKASISAVDCIGIMGATSKEDGSDFYDEKTELFGELTESVLNDFDRDENVYKLSSKSQKLLSDYLVCCYKYSAAEYAVDKSMATFIACGLASLLSICFAAVMMVFAALSMVFNLLKKPHKFAKCLRAFPMYLFIGLLVLFTIKPALGVGTAVAGAMIAYLFFAALAIVAAVASKFIFAKDRSIKVAIPKLAAAVASVVICSCLFAPFITCKVDATLVNKTKERTYSLSLSANSLVTFLTSDTIEELEETDADIVYDKNMTHVKGLVNSTIPNCSEKELKEVVGVLYASKIIDYTIIAVGDYRLTGALSIGYYVLFFVFLILGEFVCVSIAKLFKRSDKEKTMFIIAMIIIIISLILSIVLVCMQNYYLEDYEIEKCTFTVAGGAIGAIVVAIAALIFKGVYGRYLERADKNDDGEADGQSDSFEIVNEDFSEDGEDGSELEIVLGDE